MTLTGQMGLSECNELPICPVVFSHLSDPLVFPCSMERSKRQCPSPLNTALQTLFRISRTFYSIEESDKLRLLFMIFLGHFSAHTPAVCTFLRVNMCKEVIDCNCARLTVLLAKTAADTADLAHIHEGFSFFVWSYIQRKSAVCTGSAQLSVSDMPPHTCRQALQASRSTTAIPSTM